MAKNGVKVIKMPTGAGTGSPKGVPTEDSPMVKVGKPTIYKSPYTKK